MRVLIEYMTGWDPDLLVLGQMDFGVPRAFPLHLYLYHEFGGISMCHIRRQV